MKKFLLLTGAILCLVMSSVNAQVNLIKDPNGIVLGYEDTSGILYNNASVPVVSMQDSLTIILPVGDTLAIYNPGLQELRYNTGELVLKLNAASEVLNAAEQVVGRVDNAGNVYGADGLLHAVAPGISRFKLAYLFFFANR